MADRTCPECSARFDVSATPTKTYCSGPCRQRAKGRRKEQKRKERGRPSRSYVVKPSGCLRCETPIDQPATSMRLYCDPCAGGDHPRTCVDCGTTFRKWQGWKHPGAAGARCHPCYLEYTRRRQRVGPPRKLMSDAEYLENVLAKYPRQRAVQILRSGSRWQAIRGRFIEQLESFDCGFCRVPIDMTLSGLDRMGPTVDHIVPVALGGAFYDFENLRLAHRSCNAKGGRQHERIEVLAIQIAGKWIGERLAS